MFAAAYMTTFVFLSGQKYVHARIVPGPLGGAGEQACMPAFLQFVGLVPELTEASQEDAVGSPLAGCERDSKHLAFRALTLLQQVGHPSPRVLVVLRFKHCMSIPCTMPYTLPCTPSSSMPSPLPYTMLRCIQKGMRSKDLPPYMYKPC